MANKACDECGTLVKQRYASKYFADKWVCQVCRNSETAPAQIQEIKNILVTTTNTIEGKKIVKYVDVICAELIEGIGFFKDFGAGISDVFGGQASGYQKALDKMKDMAFNILKQKAHDLGANAIVGIDLDYGDLKGTMLMLVVNGTAVIVE